MNSQNLDQIKEYILKNIVPIKYGRECVDGRYSQNISGRIARPGGDFGYLMVLMRLNKEKGLGLTVKQCAEKIYGTITQNDRFFMHTDRHSKYPQIGCSHIAKAMDPNLTSLYELDPNELKEALDLIRQKTDNLEVVNLEGEHKEEGVIIITGVNYTLNHQDSTKMFFIYDKVRDNLFIDQLVPLLNIRGLNPVDFKNISNSQIQACLHNLALNLPIYEVYLDTPNPQVKFISNVS